MRMRSYLETHGRRVVAAVVVGAGVAGASTACGDANANITGLRPFDIARVVVNPALDTITVFPTVGYESVVAMVGMVIHRDGSGTIEPMVWSTSDRAVATVDAQGVVRAVAPGTVTITAEAVRKASATIVVLEGTVPEPEPEPEPPPP
jgi:hypothetical protein